ncbi:MAG: TRAP transporter fused permease subunit [Alphaproteobacteria bacterium]|nr:TRAP transporter fused permease subunit [Alphaproteobacteria bacterium]
MADETTGAPRIGFWSRQIWKGIGPGALLTFGIGVFCLVNYWYPLVPLQERALFSALTMAALFLVVAPESAKHETLWRRTDPFHALLAVVCFGYIVYDWDSILQRQGAPTQLDIYFGAATIYLLLVASVRNLGAGLTWTIAIFLAYTFFGNLLPNWLGGHRGYSLNRIFTFLFLNENGVLGFVVDACLKYMFLFLMLGKILEHVGALDFIMDLGRSVFRNYAAGAPLMAVASSGLMGMVTGSSMSNVYISGTVTIPLMKRVGVKPEFAAAIEAAASNGSQIMPPVLGFAVFFMIILLQTTYFDIAVAAILPGTLYFVSLFFTVWVRTRDLKAPPGVDFGAGAKPLTEVLLSIGSFCFFGALGGMMALMAMHMSVQTAVLYSSALCIVLSWFGKKRFGPRQAIRVIESSGRELIVITAICLTLGLITGPILLTGLGIKLPALLTDWSSGQLWLLLIGAYIACFILGTGLPTSTSYVIVALLIGTAMTSFGVPKMSAHMFVFYAALAASITPPVALTAFVAATIAKADFWKTAWQASFLGIPKYILPFGFVYRPEMLFNGTWYNIAWIAAMTTAGLFAMSYSHLYWRQGGLGRVTAALIAGAGFLMVVPPISGELFIGIAALAAGAVAVNLAHQRMAPQS